MTSIKGHKKPLLSHLAEVLSELTPKQLNALLAGVALFVLSLLFTWITFSGQSEGVGPRYFPMEGYQNIALGFLIFSVVCLGLLAWKIKWYRAEVRRLKEEGSN